MKISQKDMKIGEANKFNLKLGIINIFITF